MTTPKLILPGQYPDTHEPVPDLLPTPDFSQYDSLDELYYQALYQFSLMLGKDVPEAYRGHDKAHTIRLSNEAGIAAYPECIAILEKQAQGQPVIAKPEDYYLQSLAHWYEREIIIFVSDFTLDVPEKFHKNTERKTRAYSTKCMIRAFHRGLANLKNDLTGVAYE